MTRSDAINKLESEIGDIVYALRLIAKGDKNGYVLAGQYLLPDWSGFKIGNVTTIGIAFGDMESE